MEDKNFELLFKLYSEIIEQLREINGKLDLKADKSDLLKLEGSLLPKSNTLADTSELPWRK